MVYIIWNIIDGSVMKSFQIQVENLFVSGVLHIGLV